jgi:hypothetical protein
MNRGVVPAVLAVALTGLLQSTFAWGQADGLLVKLEAPGEVPRYAVGQEQVLGYHFSVRTRSCVPTCAIVATRLPNSHTSPDSVRIYLVPADTTVLGVISMNPNDGRYHPWRSQFSTMYYGRFSPTWQFTIPKFQKNSGLFGPCRFRVEWIMGSHVWHAFTEPFYFYITT